MARATVLSLEAKSLLGTLEKRSGDGISNLLKARRIYNDVQDVQTHIQDCRRVALQRMASAKPQVNRRVPTSKATANRRAAEEM